MKTKVARPYRQTARAEASERTRASILAAAVALWREREWDDITLADIAARAGVTVQTVLRRFSNKDGVIDACIAERASGVEALRDRAVPGELPSILDALLAHYERDGDAVLRMLQVEARSPAVRRVTAHGRKVHRAWCERVFAPFLPRASARAYPARVDAFVAATDVYLWKLLRRDLGRDLDATRAVLDALLTALSHPTPKGASR